MSLRQLLLVVGGPIIGVLLGILGNYRNVRAMRRLMKMSDEIDEKFGWEDVRLPTGQWVRRRRKYY